MRVAIYARLSRARDDSASIDRQLALGREEADRRGWHVAGEYVDDGVSGAVDPADREGMGRLLRSLSDVDVVVAWKLDRLARSFLGFADLLRQCEAHDVGIASVTEPLDTTTPMGRAMVQIIAVFAELEREMIRERILSAKDHLRLAGKHVDGRAPYGLVTATAPDGQGRVLVRDPDAVTVIREIAERVTGGESASAVARDLQGRGVPSPRMKGSRRATPAPAVWSHQSIRKIFESPTVCGHAKDDRGYVRTGEDGRPLEVWEPAVSEEQAAGVRAAIDAAYESRSKAGARHWLAGLVRCGKCGRALTQNANFKWSKSAGRITVLRCMGTRAERCGGVIVREAEFSEFVEHRVLNEFGGWQEVEYDLVPGSDPRPELEQIEATITRLRNDREAGLFDDDEEDYRARMSSLVGRRKVLRETPVQDARYRPRWSGQLIRDVWAGASPARRGELVADFYSEIIVEPANGRRNVPLAERVAFEYTEVTEEQKDEELGAAWEEHGGFE